MKFERMSTSSKLYVVLDVETNGLSGKECDLLSITFYRPDNKKVYNRFLPLELNKDVYTTSINGIKKKDLKGKIPLDQKEVDSWFKDFELDNRIILHYGNLDYRFIKAYFKRHKLSGFERMQFFNFKQLICGPRFPKSSITKDNLCEMFGIDGVTEIHTGINDCILEWKLFKKIGGRPLLATEGWMGTNFFVLNEDYIIPASYLTSHPNLGKMVDRPYVICKETREVFKFKLKGDNLQKFPTNINGIILEHLISIMVGAKEVDNRRFLIDNKCKMKLIGKIAYNDMPIPIVLNKDGTITAEEPRDRDFEKEVNQVIEEMKKSIQPLVDYIRDELFEGKRILSQELSIDNERGIMALCDLSGSKSILEIKTGRYDIEEHKEQLFYESGNRNIFILGTKWHFRKPNGKTISDDYYWWYGDKYPVSSIDFFINKVELEIGEKPDWRKERSRKALEKLSKIADNKNLEIADYQSSTKPVVVRCRTCSHEWTTRVESIKGTKIKCPICNPKNPKYSQYKSRYKKLTHEEREERRIERSNRIADTYAEKVLKLSNQTIKVLKETYTKSKEPVTVECLVCGYKWNVRSDKLLAKCSCPQCRKVAREDNKRKKYI